MQLHTDSWTHIEAVKIAEAVDTSERLLLLDKRIDNNFGYFGRGCLLPKSDH